MKPDDIKKIRLKLGHSQESFADLLGVSFATVNRWENGRSEPHRDRVRRMKELLQKKDYPEDAPSNRSLATMPVRLDFEGDAEAVKLVVDAYRLQNGHVYNKAYGLELSRVVPLPHQRIAVYEHMLTQNPLRFLLADDAGAGKTIMTGLYIREMINRGRLERVLICSPAGLTWNWRNELKHFFDLDFYVLRGIDFQKENILDNDDRKLFILSVDTAATDSVRDKLLSYTKQFDLIVFDEAHKLAWADPNRSDTKTRRYQLAEALNTRCSHLLLLTATPHAGKSFPYFALWRLLDPQVISTQDALRSLSGEKRSAFFLRRLKEEMLDYNGMPIFKPRLCQTIGYRLSPEERNFYDLASDYLRWSYETNRTINKNAASMVVAVLQRRLASSTYAMLESLKRRRVKIIEGATMSITDASSLQRIASYLDDSTADDNDFEGQGRESDEKMEDHALSIVNSAEAQLKKELEYLDRIISVGEQIRSPQRETKFLKLRELIESAEFQDQQLLVFTEHRDTMEYLRQRFEAMGYTGQIASIHGGMDVEEREQQRIFFMASEIRRSEGVKTPEAPTARIMLATDAAGEGINLQFAWVMVNYDIPWNPARLEQRMGRLHRFGQRHSEVRIFNFVAEGTREGDVLTTLLHKLDEARKELCTDKVFDVIGQQLQEVSLRDLMRDALFESVPYSAQKQLDSLLATQRLRTALEEQRISAATYGDVARRLGQLNNEIEVERFNRLLPAYIQQFVDNAAPRFGIQIEGDIAGEARYSIMSPDGDWLRSVQEQYTGEVPQYLSTKREPSSANIETSKIAFLRPGDLIFDSLCRITIQRYREHVQRGVVFCDPSAESPYYAAVYVCQVGETRPFSQAEQLFERRLFGVKWDQQSEYSICAPNHLLALQAAPRSLTWKAGDLLLNPDDQAFRLDTWSRSYVETTFLHQARSVMKMATERRLDDLTRGFDYRIGELAGVRNELARRLRQGESALASEIEEVKMRQVALENERAEALLHEQRKADLLDIAKLERIALAIVVPDPTPEAREVYNRNIEAVAMRIARNYEIDHYHAKVYDVSSPHLARGYDLESHRPNGEKIVIEVKGRSGRGPVQLTDNEWPTAANVRDKYWLYVVADCASEPKLFRVCDPIRLAFKTRQSFVLNIGDIIREAEHD